MAAQRPRALNPRQQKAVDIFMATGSKITAYCEAYDKSRNATSAKSAKEVFKSKNVSREVEKRRKLQSAITTLTDSWEEERLTEIVDRCMQHKPVIEGGEIVGVYTFDSSGANRAIEILCRIRGKFQKDNAQRQYPPFVVKNA